MGTRGLPLLIGGMAFVAALASGGLCGANVLAAHWRDGVGGVLTLQVPRGDQPGSNGQTRAQQATALLRAAPGVGGIRLLDPAEIGTLLRPWFGGQSPPADLPLPAVAEITLTPGTSARAAADSLATAIAAVPDASLDDPGTWADRLHALANSLQACAAIVLATIAGLAALGVAAATRGGVVARREAVAIAHGLGATDGFISDRFARRASRLSGGGALMGALAAVPLLLALAGVAAPLAVPATQQDSIRLRPSWEDLPPGLWIGMAAVPVTAALIGFVTAQVTVRQWLRRLP